MQPYSEPPLSVPTAQLRVITNGGVCGDAYAGCLGDSKRLAKAGRFGSTYRTCPEVKKVVVFESSKSYDAYVGLNYVPQASGETKAMCAFAVYQLLPLGKPGVVMPLALPIKPPLDRKCPSR